MERLIACLGMLAILGLAFLLSYNRRGIKLRPIAVGLALQFIFALGVLKVPGVSDLFHGFADKTESLIRLSDKGAGVLFGCLVAGEAEVVAPQVEDGGDSKDNAAGGNTTGNEDSEGASTSTTVLGRARLHGIHFARMLPAIIFFSALTSLLYFFGIIQVLVKAFALVMTRFMGVSGAESLSAAGNTVLGMTESPLLIKPHLPDLTRSELMAVMTGGFATSAGGMLALYISFGMEARFLLAASLMSAPAALVIAKIMLPETGSPLTAGTVRTAYEKVDSNPIEAIASGTTTGLKLALNVAAMLISFLAIIGLANMLLGAIWAPLTLERIFGWCFSPLAFLMGVPFEEVAQVGSLLGTKVGANELIAYQGLSELSLTARSQTIATFALCGFANFGSIGIQIGGLSILAPQRRKELARFGLRAMIGGALASWLTAALAGILL